MQSVHLAWYIALVKTFLVLRLHVEDGESHMFALRLTVHASLFPYRRRSPPALAEDIDGVRAAQVKGVLAVLPA
jgi:hypothetical protein